MLASIGCDPLRGMAMIALGEVQCLESDGLGGTCRHCGGTGKEPVPIELRARMHSELAKYVAPQLKAIEHSGDVGGSMGFVIFGAKEAVTVEQWAADNAPKV